MSHKILAILLDCGDTLVDEGTEIKDLRQVVLRASLIPGAAEMVRELKRQNYPLALVADGPAQSFYNILGHYHLLGLFDTLSISEIVGVDKPDPRMFTHALHALQIPSSSYGQVVMLGNHLERDIKGANQLGLISVWLDWAPRRAKVPADPSEQPAFTIKTPDEFIDLLPVIERSLV